MLLILAITLSIESKGHQPPPRCPRPCLMAGTPPCGHTECKGSTEVKFSRQSAQELQEAGSVDGRGQAGARQQGPSSPETALLQQEQGEGLTGTGDPWPAAFLNSPEGGGGRGPRPSKFKVL